jgi:hypothetical protein
VLVRLDHIAGVSVNANERNFADKSACRAYNWFAGVDMATHSQSDLQFEIGHVLFIDIVGYSKLLIDQQREQIRELKEIVRGTKQFRRAEAEGKLLRLPTGDGGALVFRNTQEAPLAIGAYQRFFFLRPMLANQELLNRINREGKISAFKQLRYWLYWGLVQQLSNICSDRDKRSPSITTVTRKLKDDVHLRKQLENKWVKNIREFEEAQVRADFERAYSDYLQNAEEMLSSRSVGGYKKIRDKLVSHNDLWQSPLSPTGYDFYDVKDANVTIGDERKLLETLQVLVNGLLLIVKNVESSSWDEIFQQEEEVARKYWELSAPPDENKADT